MTFEDNDQMLQALRRLTVLEPDATRSERVRVRGRTAMADRPPQGGRPMASRRFRGLVLEPGLTYALSAGYLSTVIHDLLRVYLRR